MDILKIKTESLAHYSYMVISNGEAAVIDPRRDSAVYVNKARQKDAAIKYIFETHRNEDFVSGSRELKRQTGAVIFHGTGLAFQYGEFVTEGDAFKIGEVALQILETPGHTPESISIALYPEEDSQRAVAVFSGDALFVNDVGRTDFFEDRKKEFAGLLHDSLHKKILPLGDQCVIYPAHGAGSVCGGGISDREVSTVGYERLHNPKLQMNKEDFIKMKVNEIHPYPPYFKNMERINLLGDDNPIDQKKTMDFLSPSELNSQYSKLQVVDIRSIESYAGCHIPQSINIPADMVGSYAGYFIDYVREICLIANSHSQAMNFWTELKRLGFENDISYLRGGITAWEVAGKPLENFRTLDVNQVTERIESKENCFIDVRSPSEWEEGIIKGAKTIFLGQLSQRASELPRDKNLIVYCGSGTRATIGASILGREGYQNLSIFMGSMKAYDSYQESAA